MGWVRGLFQRRRMEEVLDDEIRRHIDLQAAEYIAAGTPPEEARLAARRRFGTVSSVKERCREESGAARVETIWQDLRFGLRSFVSEPGFTLVVLITLALGVGANTAVFSVLRAVLLDPLPLPEPDRIVMIWEHDRIRGTTKENASYPDYLDLKESCRQFDYLAASQRMDVTLTGRGEPQRLPAARVTSEFFHVLGLRPAIGRFFGPGEDGIVISYSLWQRSFGGSADVVGASVSLDGLPGTVLGVMPPEASMLSPTGAELWSSLETVRATQFRGQHGTTVWGRLRRGARIEQAQAEVTAVMARLERDYPDDNLGRGAGVVALHEELAGTMRPALRALSAAVAVLLLLACVNIANLLLARASARGREMAIRISLGAARGRLARQLLTESLLLSAVGAALGVGVAWLGIRGLIVLAPEETPLIGRTSLNSAALLLMLGISLLAWIVFGLLPALRVPSVSPGAALQGSGRATPTGGSLRLRHALVMAQVAMAAALVIVSGLLIRSFQRLQQVELGYQPRHTMTLRVKLPETRYPWPKFPFTDWPAAIAFQERLRSAVRRIPGVEAVSMAMAGPERASWTTRVTVEGRPAVPSGEQEEAQLRIADPEYLEAAGARLVRGRFFGATDDARHPFVAVVNESFVRRHFPAEDPLHQSIRVFGVARQVVGVIGDMRYGGPGTAPEPAMYFPMRQTTFPDLTLLVRSAREPADLAPRLRQAVLAADADVASFGLTTLEDALRRATARQRFVLSLLTGFAAVAIVLAAVGIYGVVAYSVGRRRQEIALRMALGAGGRDIFSQVVGGTLLRSTAGAAIGISLAMLGRRMLEPLLFEVSPRDPATHLAVAALLLAVAFAAAAPPAGRAARVSPAMTLRQG